MWALRRVTLLRELVSSSLHELLFLLVLVKNLYCFLSVLFSPHLLVAPSVRIYVDVYHGATALRGEGALVHVVAVDVSHMDL